MAVTVNPGEFGDIVQITEHNPGLDTDQARSDVIDAFKYSQDGAKEQGEKMDSALERIFDLLGSLDVPEFSAVLKRVFVDKVNFPQAENFAKIILSTAYPSEVPVKPILAPFGTYDYDFHAPEKPKRIEGSFSWRGEVYSSPLRPRLISNIQQSLINGDHGLTPAVHQAILDREQRARLRNQVKVLRDAQHSAGANGFRLPGGQITAVTLEIYKAQAYQDQDALNAITEKDFDLAQRNREFSHSFALDLDRLMSGEWDANETRRFEAAKAVFDLSIELGKFDLELFRILTDGEKERILGIKTSVEAQAANWKAKTDMYTSEWDGYRANVEAVGSENTSKVQIRGLEVDNWYKKVQAAAAEQNANIQISSFEWQQILEQVRVNLGIHQSNIEGYKAEASLKESGFSTVAKIIAQVLASTIGVMSASASESFSGSESRSDSRSQGRSLSESYSGEMQ